MVASHTSVVTADPPAQTVDQGSSGWPGLVGTYRLRPDGWTFHVELRNGVLHWAVAATSACASSLSSP